MATVAVVLSSGAAQAQTQTPAYPVKPVRMIVPFPAGGNLDTNARVLAQKLTESFGQQVVVENRPGAGGIIGSEFVARSAADGYILLFAAAGNHTTNPSLYAKLPYDTVRDFTPISNFVRVPLVLVVHPSRPVKSVRELIALAKAQPGQINAANGGNGSSGHLAMSLFMSTSGAKLTQIPYKGNAPALADTIAGQTAVMIDTLSTSLGQIKGGRVRALAVTSPQRSSLMPEVPTIAEAALPGFEANVYNGVLGPAGMPNEIVAKLASEVARVAQNAEVRQRLGQQAVEVIGSTSAEFAAFIKTDIAKWEKVIREAGIKAD
jgi:tripartite-type tricarboxylate transporter receptor subunit TctC